ncbi:MAG: hypothetical protein JXR37_00515 [Kiritimatiellae bacterium]|nr:hypothetical protein [Kiritimatiellia bacterium]
MKRMVHHSLKLGVTCVVLLGGAALGADRGGTAQTITPTRTAPTVEKPTTEKPAEVKPEEPKIPSRTAPQFKADPVPVRSVTPRVTPPGMESPPPPKDSTRLTSPVEKTGGKESGKTGGSAPVALPGGGRGSEAFKGAVKDAFRTDAPLFGDIKDLVGPTDLDGKGQPGKQAAAEGKKAGGSGARALAAGVASQIAVLNKGGKGSDISGAAKGQGDADAGNEWHAGGDWIIEEIMPVVTTTRSGGNGLDIVTTVQRTETDYDGAGRDNGYIPLDSTDTANRPARRAPDVTSTVARHTGISKGAGGARGRLDTTLTQTRPAQEAPDVTSTVARDTSIGKGQAGARSLLDTTMTGTRPAGESPDVTSTVMRDTSRWKERPDESSPLDSTLTTIRTERERPDVTTTVVRDSAHAKKRTDARDPLDVTDTTRKPVHAQLADGGKPSSPNGSSGPDAVSILNVERDENGRVTRYAYGDVQGARYEVNDIRYSVEGDIVSFSLTGEGTGEKIIVRAAPRKAASDDDP